MDPDMVRQQEEAEEEARRLTLGIASAATTAAPVLDRPIPKVVAPKSDETETVLVHAHVPGLPPLIPMKRKKKRAESPVDARARIGWFVALRVSLYALIMSALGLLGGIMVGVKLGLAAPQSLALGAGIGFLLGWQAAFVSLRANRDISFAWAMLISVWPAIIVLVMLIAAMVAGSHFTGIQPDSIAAGQIRAFWMIVGSGALLALLLSTVRTRKLTVR